jgi:hypothetical protein
MPDHFCATQGTGNNSNTVSLPRYLHEGNQIAGTLIGLLAPTRD